MRRKPYNFLDQRKGEFDQDYEDFKRGIDDLHNQTSVHMDTMFDRVPSTMRSVALLRKFEKLEIPKLEVVSKYKVVLNNYSKEVDGIAKMYSKQKNNPPLPRNSPPLAGKF